MITTTSTLEVTVRDLLEQVTDPEIPVLSIIDLGILRKISADENEIEVFITPTYTGCPAMDAISLDIKLKLIEHGFKNIKVTQVLSPVWTTDWMSETGKQKLKEYGIAPPNPRQQTCNEMMFAEQEAIQCPHCDSYNTKRISEFGSTACKSLYQCQDCKEPFDYFKCH